MDSETAKAKMDELRREIHGVRELIHNLEGSCMDDQDRKGAVYDLRVTEKNLMREFREHQRFLYKPTASN